MTQAAPAGTEEFKFPDEKKAGQQTPTEDQIEIEIEDDTPPEDRGRKPMATPAQDPTDEELGEYSEKVQKRMKELTRARHDERRRAEAAEREREEAVRAAQELLRRNKELGTTLHHGETAYAATAVAAAEGEIAAAKAELKKAHEDFDSDAIVAAQTKLTEATLKLQAAKSFKPRPLQQEEEGVHTQQHAGTQPRPDERTLRWQAQNAWFGVDDEMTAVALAVHRNLVQSGTDPRSDKYFEQLDARMRKRFPDFFGQEPADDPKEDDQPQAKKEKEKPATVVAPVSRTTTTRKVRLTQSQVTLAKRLGLSPEQYVKELMKLENANG